MMFRSKIDTWLGALLVMSALAQVTSLWIFFAIGIPGRWVAAPLLIIGIGLVLWILTTTYYVVDNDNLLIRCGPMKWNIPLKSITGVSETRSPLSSPALSLHRISISHGSGKSLMVSPQDRAGFIEALRLGGARVG